MIVIIGNGIAGVTAARHIRKRSNDPIMIISSETRYFFARTAIMYVYMGHMKFEHTKPYEDWFWEKNRIDLKQDRVTDIHFTENKLSLQSGEVINYSTLILALGSKSNMFGWPGQDLKGVGGLYNYQDLEKIETYTKDIEQAVIVGGGLIGIEMAEMLRSRDIAVKFLVREDRYWSKVLSEEESALTEQEIRDHNVDLMLETELDRILGDENGRVRAVITKTGEEIPCQWVGLTAGVSPNIDFLKDSELKTDKGILVDKFMRTSFENVYAIGDCAQFEEPAAGRRPIEQIWYTGKIMGEAVAKTITGEPTPYNPGYFFNSAKFFNIEFQTYGNISGKPEDGQEQFFWGDQSGKKAMRFIFNSSDRRFVGMNTFGIRLRHATFHEHLSKNRTIEYVLEHLKDANFDPEFYKRYESDIIEKFNKDFGTDIQPKKFSWKRLLAYNS